MPLFQNISISKKLITLIVLASLSMLITVSISLFDFKQNLYKDKQSNLKSLVENSSSLIDYYYQQQLSGKLSQEQAQAEAIKTIETLKYGEDGYFWINDMTPNMVMHPTKPSLNGKPVKDIKDPNGKALFVEFINVVKAQQAGFVEYQWARPDSDTPIDKLSYVAGFEPWGWVIGTGVYIDDIQHAFAEAAIHDALIFLVSLAILLIIAAMVIKGINGSVHHLQTTMKTIATDRDLRIRANLQSGDEIGLVAKDLDHMLNQLQPFMANVIQTSTNLNVASNQVSALAAQTQQDMAIQQDESDQVAAAMNEVSATSQEVARSAQETADAADQADSQAKQATIVFNSAAESIRKLSVEVEHSAELIRNLEEDVDKIGQVIDVISNIADQTNLLALNAAIEAARAGENGRGFAVVAEEVRNLAQRTQGSTEEIQNMIEKLQRTTTSVGQSMGSSYKNMMTCSEESSKAKESIDLVTASMDQINLMSAQIGSAAQEQSQVVEEITRNLVNIAEVAIQTNNSAHETAQAANNSLELSQQLATEASTFKG